MEEVGAQEVSAVEEVAEVKRVPVESNNGRKPEGGGPRNSVFTWFMVLALLGVWSSVAVVWFGLVDYDSVIARARQFRGNFSEVLQGKLRAYDADRDGDFDVEDAKVLLGLAREGTSGDSTESLEEVLDILAEEGSDWFYGFFTFLFDVVTSPVEKGEEEEREEAAEVVDEKKHLTAKREKLEKGLKQKPVSVVQPAEPRQQLEETETSHEQEPKAGTNKVAVQDDVPGLTAEDDDVDGSQMLKLESEIQAAVPLPPPSEEEFVPEDKLNTIDTKGELVEESQPQETLEESGPYEDQSGSQYIHKPASEPEPHTEPSSEPQSQGEQESAAEPQAEPAASESTGSVSEQPEEKLIDKVKKKKPKLLNKFDKTIKAEIEAADKLRKKGIAEEAVRAFEALVQQYPHSPRCRYGKAQAEDDMAEKKRSNEMLQKAINTYREASELPSATPDLVRASLKRRAERQQFLGRMRGALATLEKLVQIFPEDLSLKNDLGVSYLLLGDNHSARRVYEEVLAVAPDDGFAKVHYGFILKSENKIAESIPYLREGLESGDPGTDDGRFYFHLGDALQRVGDNSVSYTHRHTHTLPPSITVLSVLQAYEWYARGHQRGHFASVWQRSLYNVKGLRAQPWWTPQETGYTDLVKALEKNWRVIRDEALSVMDTSTGLFLPEEENLREKGEWGQFTLWQQGRKAGEACRSVPRTCSLLERYSEATGCKRGQIKFSVMQPGTHVWPHTGPTNCRLRMHLGLVIPKQGCKIRCTNDTRVWEEGKVLIFDDSFEHEVWQDSDSYRLIFIIDVWHPELSQHQRQVLSPI
ncbi:aspartyl/asparaginyl beta-hydroxylase isoform X5 [Hypomesus transpacificus]|uniref:aspartyl/asparaginyl beta-hydroxylase isoform X5 n=1 Tax=Hypomesus transpacificus TaxID=137520 RepID=UPI001F085B08|nr:aspartyl/asparaginyl beta-hydroxylase isoform X5 [Hypomesus transpacificus]